MVRLSFYGAAGEVTGSNFLVEGKEHKYVVDCGLFQGADTITEDNRRPFAYEPATVSAVLVTHAHLDHIGRLPKLVREGLRGSIYGTEATLELTELVLKDALDLMERRHQHQSEPMLYESADLRRAMTLFRATPYQERTELNNGDNFTLFEAGHILGSASVLLEVEGKKLVFSGDIGHSPSTLLPPPEPPIEADVVVTEATYGGQEHEAGADRLKVLKDALEWTMKERGVLLIPAFSIERSQELLFLFHELFHRHQLPKVPIFLDSPLAIEALEIFERHRSSFARSIQNAHGKGDDPFSFRGLALTSSVEQSKEINDLTPPKVIIAGSGMMVGGRISHHLKHYLARPNTYLLVIGFQAPGTLGAKIASGVRMVTIMDERLPVKAKVIKSEAFSGHADNSELLGWLGKIKINSDGKIFIVHSDLARARDFQTEARKAQTNSEVIIARHGETVDL